MSISRKWHKAEAVKGAFKKTAGRLTGTGACAQRPH